MNAYRKTAEEFLWTAEILMNMGRYAQAFMLACHSLNLCLGGKEPFEKTPKECRELIFPQNGLTPEDLVTEEHARRIIEEAKKCLKL